MTELVYMFFLGFLIGYIFASNNKNKPNKDRRNDEFYY